MLDSLLPALTLSFSLLLAQAQTAAKEPDPPRGLLRSEPGAFAGTTLVAPLGSRFTYLIDMQGRVVQRWESQLGPSACYLLGDGSILRSGRLEENKTFSGGGICGRLERIGWDGELLWTYDLSNEDQTQHHDALPMPNGNVLLITWEFRYLEDAIAAGRDPARTPDKGFWPDAVLEIKPTPPTGGEVVWEWHAWDHLIQDFDPEQDNYGPIPEHPERIDINYDHRDRAPMTEEERQKQEELEAEMRALGYAGGDEEDDASAGAAPNNLAIQDGNGSDWLHANAVDYDPVHDLVLLSSPNLSEIWILDHSTTSDQAAGNKGGRYGKGGDLLWRWGNPKNYGAGEEGDRRLFYQHNAQWIPAGLPGAGHVLVFNNGQGRPEGDFSSVEELVLPFDPAQGFAPGSRAFGPEQPAWSYTAADKSSFFGAFISGCQRLPNGNTLICEGPKGRVFEVTSAGAIVWEYVNPHGGDLLESGGGGIEKNALFRATRIAPDHPGLKGRTLEPLEIESSAAR